MAGEHEVPENFRGYIKDEKTEKEIKELLQKAYGLDHVSSARAKVQEEYKTYKSQTEPIMKIANTLDHYAKKGDLNGYFSTLGLSKQEIYQWALQQAEIEGLPEQQKQVYTKQQEAEMRAYELEQQLREREEEATSYKVNQREQELAQTISTPEVSSFVQEFDERNGQGAFRAEIISRGRMYWRDQGKDLSAQELVTDIMKRFGVQSPQSQVMTQQQQAPQQPMTQAGQRQVPVIPNTGPGNTSPAKRKVRSLADIEKLTEEKYG